MKDKFRINATIFGNEIECGFEMPEGLEGNEYDVIFSKRFTKCLIAFNKALTKIIRNDKDLEQ